MQKKALTYFLAFLLILSPVAVLMAQEDQPVVNIPEKFNFASRLEVKLYLDEGERKAQLTLHLHHNQDGHQALIKPVSFYVKSAEEFEDTREFEGEALIYDQIGGQTYDLHRPADKTGKMMKNQVNTSLDPDAVKIEKTGETKKILGYDCQRIVYRSPEADIELWITEALNLPNYISWFTNLPAQGFSEMFPFATIPEGFPLEIKVLAYGTGGWEERNMRLEVLAIHPDAPLEFNMKEITWNAPEEEYEEAVEVEMPIEEVPEVEVSPLEEPESPTPSKKKKKQDQKSKALSTTFYTKKPFF
ncbi:MAG: DUF4412 domain-containing protein [Microscillaceae bacterium]|nr:DUF4412 domain-containing protein [Microscillaceae bacterium]